MTPAELKESTPTYQPDQHLIAGRYQTNTRIGRGRLGEIFAATDKGYEELGVEPQLAIQVIPDGVVRNKQLFNKINLGYTTLQSAAHPNIVKFLHFGSDGKFGYLAMELLDGLSLRSVLDNAEMLALDEAKPVIRSVGEALRLLHAKNMVHGNLTTGNVFITQEFKVRLLDVLPLESSDAILRDVATSEPFSRFTVEDDVFGLACLAYEMLAGKHPFNYITPAEASVAGLEPDRIASLAEHEWHALRWALSFDRSKRTSSIADFLYDFGISGAESLRPAIDEPARHESIVYPTEEETPPKRPRVVAVQNTATVAPVVAVKSNSRIKYSDSYAQPMSKRARPARAVLLAMLLAVVSAWFYYGQAQEQAVDLIGYLDESFGLGLVAQNDAVIEISIPDPDRSVSTDRVVSVEQAAVAATVVAIPADLEAQQAKTERTTNMDDNVSAVVQSTDQPAPLYPIGGGDTMVTVAEVANLTADNVLTDANADLIQTESELVFRESFVLASESDGAARIVLPRTASSATPLIWWTSEHTAYAGTDFVSVEQQTVANASIEDGNTVHIPLVNDNLPEPQESFFVNFGLRNSQLGRIERIATVRVDISDDD